MAYSIVKGFFGIEINALNLECNRKGCARLGFCRLIFGFGICAEHFTESTGLSGANC